LEVKDGAREGWRISKIEDVNTLQSTNFARIVRSKNEMIGAVSKHGGGKKCEKVNISLYRPKQALRAAGVRGCRDFV
jgi:hypothetical protein